MTDTEIKRIPAPEPGIYPGIPFETYLAWDAVSSSLLKDMARTAKYAHERMIRPEDDKKAYVKGRLFHLLSTGASNADEEFIVSPETYIADRGKDKGDEKPWNGNATVCKEWAGERQASGMTIVKADVYADASGMAEKVREHPKLGRLLAGAQVELTVVWMDKTTGLKCKARFDLFKGGVVCDLKSSAAPVWAADWTANPFFRNARKFRYHIQVAHYLEGMKAHSMNKGVAWVILAGSETYRPYQPMCYDVFDDIQAESYKFLTLGRLKRYMLMVEYKQCVETGVWPGYPTEHEDMMLDYAGQKELDELQGLTK